MSSSDPSVRLTYPQKSESLKLDLGRSKVLIGRNTTCDIVIRSPEVSRVHCSVEQGDEGWYVCDQNSRNGTYLNGNRVVRELLRPNDAISFDPNSRHWVIFEDGLSQDLSQEKLLWDDSEADVQSSKVDVVLDVSDMEKSLVMSPESTVLPIRAATTGRTRGDGEVEGHAGTSVIALFSRMGQALLTSEALQSMLEKVLDLVFEQLPVDRGLILLWDAKKEGLVEAVTRKGDVSAPIKISKSIVDQVMEAKKSILVRNAVDDERFSTAASIIQYGIRSAMCVPMYHEGQVLGIVYVDIQSGSSAFAESDLELLTALAVFAAAGVHQARLRADVEREKRIRTRLARYSSPAVVEQIVAEDIDTDGELHAEEKDVTVLFADLQGFTSLSERLSPAEVARLLNTVFDKLTGVVFRHEGTLDKYIGDGVMCVFGAPLPMTDHATRAVEAAVAMFEALAELNEGGHFDAPVAMRIGLNSGLVVAGDLGSPERRDYTVLGDTVNVASRLESAIAAAGQIVVGPRTYELARECFDFEALPAIQLKGKEKAVRPYRVIGRKAAGGTSRAAGGD